MSLVEYTGMFGLVCTLTYIVCRGSLKKLLDYWIVLMALLLSMHGTMTSAVITIRSDIADYYGIAGKLL